MSKKSQRAKLPRPMKQLQPKLPSALSQTNDQVVGTEQYARQQLRQGDFVGTIRTSKSLLNSLPTNSAMRIEPLALQGLAYSMLKQPQESYDVFSEALSIDPTIPDLWYNHGLASSSLSHFAEAVRDHEHAFELTKHETGEVARKIAKALESSRRNLKMAMKIHGEGVTLEEYTRREENFTLALNMMKQHRWQEGELLFRQLAELGLKVPSYWGNLGASLVMQGRYDEAEEALTQALAIDPNYAFARDNLQKLPRVRRGKVPPVGGELEERLSTRLTMIDPEATINGYEVIGTLDREEWNQVKQEPLSFEQVVEYLHDFTEIVTFDSVSK